jgi:hypothetical protein
MMFTEAANLLDQVHTWSTIYCIHSSDLEGVFVTNALHLHDSWLRTKQFIDLCKLLEDFPNMGILVCNGKDNPTLIHGIKPTDQPPNFHGFIGNKINSTPIEFEIDKKCSLSRLHHLHLALTQTMTNPNRPTNPSTKKKSLHQPLNAVAHQKILPGTTDYVVSTLSIRTSYPCF